ncbi:MULTISPECIES: LCP family protein [unclassified Actinomyces]|uniref:LCP family protein n=1 Tax=unclassified Actinomyces TaxID=2609248 RepID=UPI001F26599D|nr:MULTISPECIES: LCP family protein [unclassified Actinomyces]
MSSTDDGDLPPSFTPGNGKPSRRTSNPGRPARPSGQQARRPATTPASFEPRPNGRSADGDAAAHSGAAPRRPLQRRASTSSSGGAPVRASETGRSGAAPRSRARAGSSAVPLSSTSSRSARAPEGTRVLPAGAAPSERSRNVPRPPAAARPGTLAPTSALNDHTQPEPPSPPTRKRRHHPLRWVAAVLVLLLALVGARVAWLAHDVNSKLQRVEALSGADDTPGETWLIVGSDSRADGAVVDNTEGARSDSIMLLHKAPGGQASLTSLPRDTFVEIPGYGGNKINAAYSYGGPTLLVATVEQLTGLTVDHYVEVSMGGVSSMVDAVGGINVCLDYDVNDADSGLVWDTSQGECQDVDGEKALAYSRMRKSDPTGDIGRGLRQRAVISAVVSKAVSTSTLTSFSQQDTLVNAGTQALVVDQDASMVDLGQMLLAFRSASNAGLTGAPPIASLDYEPGGIGAAVLLEDTTAPGFFGKLREGTLQTSDFNQS